MVNYALGGALLLLMLQFSPCARGFAPACTGNAFLRRSSTCRNARPAKLSMISQSERETAKKELLVLASGGKRGKATKEAIIQAVRRLEQMNPTPKPAESKLLSGSYSLLFTGSETEDELKARKEREGLVGSALTEASGASDAGEGSKKSSLGGLVVSKETAQDIDLEGGKVANRATFSVAGVPLEVSIEGTCARVNDPPFRDTRIDVAFRCVRITLGELPSLTIPLDWVNGGTGPQGSVITTDVRHGNSVVMVWYKIAVILVTQQY